MCIGRMCIGRMCIGRMCGALLSQLGGAARAPYAGGCSQGPLWGVQPGPPMQQGHGASLSWAEMWMRRRGAIREADWAVTTTTSCTQAFQGTACTHGGHTVGGTQGGAAHMGALMGALRQGHHAGACPWYSQPWLSCGHGCRVVTVRPGVPASTMKHVIPLYPDSTMGDTTMGSRHRRGGSQVGP